MAEPPFGSDGKAVIGILRRDDSDWMTVTERLWLADWERTTLTWRLLVSTRKTRWLKHQQQRPLCLPLRVVIPACDVISWCSWCLFLWGSKFDEIPRGTFERGCCLRFASCCSDSLCRRVRVGRFYWRLFGWPFWPFRGQTFGWQRWWVSGCSSCSRDSSWRYVYGC